MPGKLPAGAQRTDLSLIARLTGAARGLVAGFEGGFNPPGSPLPVEAPAGTRPRAFDYPGLWNMRQRPKSQESLRGASHEDCRALADACEILRIILEYCKDRQATFGWSWRLRPRPGEKPDELRDRNQSDPRVEYLNRLWRWPDRENNTRGWIRAIMEDRLVVDAVALEPRWNGRGQLVGLDLIDGATVTRLIDDTGRTPAPPAVAYQQSAAGVVCAEWRANELLYARSNVRTSRVYGFSPVEQTITSINTAIRRALFQMSYYTEGNLGTAFIPVPDDWSLDEVKEMQAYWDVLIGGQPSEQAKAHFVPFGQAPVFPQRETLKDEFDEWIARTFCAAVGISPNPWVKGQNRATAEATREEADAVAMMTQTYYLKDLFEDAVARFMGWADVECVPRHDRPIDSVKQAQADEIYVRIGVKSVDEVRGEIGYQPIGVGNGVITGGGFLPFQPSPDHGGQMAALPPKQEQAQPGGGDPRGDGTPEGRPGTRGGGAPE